MVTIPRAEIDTVMDCYNATWPTQGDASSHVVREAVAVIRREAASIFSTKFEEVFRRTQLTKLADDLDTLAERCEQEGR
jgi:hypothetical protein